MKVNIDLLTYHPLIIEIYGQDDDEQFKELVNRIKESGFVEPIIINREYKILSGHRRHRAVKLLGFDSIECQMVNDPPEHELEILLSSNVYREKTTVQKLKEAEYYFQIESKKARERQLSGVTLETSRTQGGRTDEIVAEKIGMSPSSYKRARKVVQESSKISDRALKWLLEETLNEDITAAQKLSEQPEDVIKQVYEVTGGDESQVGKVLRNLQKLEIKKTIPLPPGKYSVIYSEYGKEDFERCSKISIGDLAEADSVLFLWTLPSFLEQAMKLVHIWGFRYKTAFLWNKDVLNDCSNSGEIMLIGIKGNPPMITLSNENSSDPTKPPIIREMINQVYHQVDKVNIHLGEGWELW